ncbi:MAG TPA: serine hydrolase domain-containing protein [Burkholderiaceae bacterium]|nr:serine hydrolase domain-containing protein [Burkholderiaceae bacterium]
MDAYPLPRGDLAASGLRADRIERLLALVDEHRRAGRYPGAQIALARRGTLLLDVTVGDARIGPAATPARDDTLWLLYSNTKVLVACALWRLVEDGALGLDDAVAEHLPGFERHGKQAVTIHQVVTHQGGFPNAELAREGWTDRDARRASILDFRLEWEPGSRMVYHPLSAHWVLGAVIEAVTGEDLRDVLRRRVIEPLGLGRELRPGLLPEDDARAADMHEPAPGGGLRVLHDTTTETWRRACAPGGGAYGTARGMVALYQMMLGGGALGDRRLVSPRTLEYALRNHTGDRVDEFMGMPMHRGIGPHLRGTTRNVRGLGSLAAPECFGHGGVGSSYCWGDPRSGVSFAYLTNARLPEPWHSRRLERVSNLVHAAIVD